jgi:hypothetical protein
MGHAAGWLVRYAFFICVLLILDGLEVLSCKDDPAMYIGIAIGNTLITISDIMRNLQNGSFDGSRLSRKRQDKVQ